MSQRSDNAAFFGFWDKVGTFVLSNLLWLVCALPLVTLPAATAALFAILAPFSRGQPVEPLTGFFRALREYWRKSSIIGLIDLVVFGVITANLIIFARMDGQQLLTRVSQVATLFFGFAALLINLYIWPLLVTFKLTLRQLFDTALRMAFGHALWSMFLLCLVIVMLLISTQLPSMFTIIGTVSACVLWINWGTWRVIRRYVAPEEMARFKA